MLGDLYLCASTVGDVDLRTRIAAAQAGRYAGIGLRPQHLRRELDSGRSAAEVRPALDRAGLEVIELGYLDRWWQDGEDGRASRRHEQSLYDLASVVGGRHMVLVGGSPEQHPQVVADRFAAVCDRAAAHGLMVALEPLPWTRTGTLAEAWAVVQRAAQPGSGVVLDSWHHARGGGNDQELEAVPADRVLALQLSDGELRPVEGDLEDTFRRRLLPGQGEFALDSLLAGAAAHGIRAPVGVEVLSDELRRLDARDAAAQAADAARAVLARAAGG